MQQSATLFGGCYASKGCEKQHHNVDKNMMVDITNMQGLGMGPPKLPEGIQGHKGLAAIIIYLIEMKTYNAYLEEKITGGKNLRKNLITHPVSGLFK